MRHTLAPLAAWLIACAPPAEIDLDDDSGGGGGSGGDPYIEVVFPQNNSVLELADDCSLTTPVAVQIQNFELVDFIEFPSPTAGQGHWHLQLTGDPSYQPISAGKSEVITRPNRTPGTVSITATLVNSQHQAIDVGVDEASAEITLAAPQGITCPLP